jgi:hypothetical protein
MKFAHYYSFAEVREMLRQPFLRIVFRNIDRDK